MKIKTFNDLFVDMVKDMYSAESQLAKVLPKMAKKSSNQELKKAFETHYEQTVKQKERLERVAEILDITPKGKKCVAMEGIIEEAEDIISEVKDQDVLDAGIIGASQKAEHYEIASYGTLCTFAKQLGDKEILNLLLETLDEEKGTDSKLTQIAERMVNEKAAQHA